MPAGFTVGAAHIQVLPSIRGLHRDLGKQLRGVKASIPAKVTPEMDKAAAAKVEAEMRSLSQRLAKARDAETLAAGRVKVAEAKLRETRESGKASTSQLVAAQERLVAANLALSNAQQHTARLTEHYTTAQKRASEATRNHERSSRGLLTSLRGVATHLQQIDDSKLRRTLGTLGKIGGVATVAAAGIFSLGSSVPALVSLAGALASVAGAAALIPAALGAGGLALGAAVVGSIGLVDAFKPETARAQASAASSVAAARRSADRAVVASAEQVRSAEQALTRAQESARDAQDDLTRARKQAVEQLEDLQLALSGAQLGERAADIALRRARERLAELQAAGTTGLDLEEAVLGVDEAQQAVKEAADRYADLREEAAAAEQAGVDGADNVVAAQRRVADTTQDVADAQHQLALAHQQAADAQADAATALAEAQQRLADSAPTQLAASATAFVAAVKELGPAWTALRLDVQERLFAGVAEQVRSLGGRYLPVMRGALGGVADILNRRGRGIAEFFGQPKIVADVTTELGNMRTGLDQASRAILPLTQAWHDIMVVGSTFLPGLGAKVGDLGERFGVFIGHARETGRLGEWIQTGLDRLHQLGSVVFNVGSILGSVWSAARDAGADFLVTVRDVTGALAASLKTPAGAAGLHSFFAGLRGLVDSVRPGLRVLGEGLGHLIVDLAGVLPKVGVAFSSAARGAKPLLDGLGWLVRHVLPPLVDALTWLGPALAPLAVFIGGIVLAVKAWGIAQTFLNFALKDNPIGIVVTVLGLLVGAFILAYNHSERFRNFVNNAWVGIQEVVGFAWNNVIRPVFDALSHYLTDVVGPAYIWLWHEVIEPAAKGIGDAISWGWDHVIKPAFEAIKTGVKLVGDAFGSAVDFVGRVWGGLKQVAAAPVNFVLDVVYNKGIKAAWDKIAAIVHLDELPKANLIDFGPAVTFGGAGSQLRAAGGAVLSGYAPGRDSVPALLSPGEAVLVPELVRQIGADAILAANAAASGRRPGGMGRYAGGGVVGQAVDFIGSAAASTARLFADPVGTLKRLFGDPGAKVRALGDSQFVELLARIPGKIIESAVSFLTDAVRGLVGSGGPVAAGAGVQRWSGVVLQALGLLGQPAALLPNVLSRMQRESGGNPLAINLSDINAQRGTPSVGLMQVIGPTFRAYAGPFADTGPFLRGVSTDALANIYAGLNYATHRYPSLQYAMDKPGGYDAGGWLPPGYNTIYNGTRRPEAILNGDQWDVMRRAADGPRSIIADLYDRDGALIGRMQGIAREEIKSSNDHVGSSISRGRRF